MLKAVAEVVDSAIISNRHRPRKNSIPFLKVGEKPQPLPRTNAGWLSTASDWQLKVDLGNQLKVPEHIIQTRLRRIVLIYSDATKQVIMWELTVPWEEHMEEAHERKLAKYQDMVEDCRGRGWQAHCEPTEVGCRGFAGQLICKALTGLGVTGAGKRGAIHSITEAAEKAT